MWVAVSTRSTINDANLFPMPDIAILPGIAAAAIVGIVMQVAFLGWMQGQGTCAGAESPSASRNYRGRSAAGKNFGGSPFQFFAPDIRVRPDGNPLLSAATPPSVCSRSAVAVAVGVGLWLLLKTKDAAGIMGAFRVVDDRQDAGGLAASTCPLIAVFGSGPRCGAGRLRRRHRRQRAQPTQLGIDVKFLLTSLVLVIVAHGLPFQAPRSRDPDRRDPKQWDRRCFRPIP